MANVPIPEHERMHRIMQLYQYQNWLALRPEAGGYSGNDWRVKYDQAEVEIRRLEANQVTE